MRAFGTDLRVRVRRRARTRAPHAVIPTARAVGITRRVIGGPAKQGRDRANRTHEEIAGHRLTATGARSSRRAVRRFGSGIGLRPYRPTRRHDRGDPVKQAQARDHRTDLGTGRRPGRPSR